MPRFGLSENERIPPGRPSMPMQDNVIENMLGDDFVNADANAPANADQPVQDDANVPADVDPLAQDGGEVQVNNDPQNNQNQQENQPPADQNNNAPPENHEPPANQQQNVPAPQQNNDEPLTRNSVLKRRLVDNYKERKEERNFESTDNEVAHNNELKKNAALDKISDVAFYGSLAGTLPPMLFGLGSTAMDAAGDFGIKKFGNKDDKNSFTGKYHDLNKNNKTQDVLNGISALGNASGMISYTTGYFSNRRRAKKDKNANHRKVSEMKKKANISYLLQSTAGLVGNINNMGAFGDRPVDNGVERLGTKTSILGGVAGAIGGISGFAGKYFDFKTHKLKKKLHKETADKVSGVKRRNANEADNTIEAANFALRHTDNIDTEVKREKVHELRKMRHTAKAQKYAMDMAARLHERKSKGASKGWAGLLSAGLSAVGSLFTAASSFGGILKNAGPIGSILSGIGGAGTFLGHVIGDKMIAGKRRGNKMKADKKQIVEEYLQKKAEKIKAEAASIQFTEEEIAALGRSGDVLSDTEAKRLAVMRLGVRDRSLWEKIRGKQKEADSPLTGDAYDAVFNMLVKKRANNIMQSGEKERNEMLDALGLDHDAGIEDVEAAINPDDAL